MTAPLYPGKALRRGDSGEAVRALQLRLAELGVASLKGTGTFAAQTEAAVRLYQAQHVDPIGRALEADGIVGPLTWAALFGAATAPHSAPPATGLPANALLQAIHEIGVTEQPVGSNRGPQVDRYLKSVGLNPATGSYAWCQAFVYWCFNTAAMKMQRTTPLPRTAGVMEHWRRAPSCARKVTAAAALNDPSKIGPGCLFLISSGGGLGHIGFVERVQLGGHVTTVEGNTNVNGGREGTGVFRRQRRLSAINLGFISYENC